MATACPCLKRPLPLSQSQTLQHRLDPLTPRRVLDLDQLLLAGRLEAGSRSCEGRQQKPRAVALAPSPFTAAAWASRPTWSVSHSF